MLLFAALAVPFAGRAESHGYAFAGPVGVANSPFSRWEGALLHVGAGGEYGIGKRFGVGGEGGIVAPLNNSNGSYAGIASGTAYFHPIGVKSRLSPFVAGGGSMLIVSGGAGMAHVGGGVNIWLHRRAGALLEFRDHIWPAESDSTVHFPGFRFGIVFR
jgi:hypothetical protein